MIVNYELTYDLPGPRGGHRADPRDYELPDNCIDEEGSFTSSALSAIEAAQTGLDNYVMSLIVDGASNIRMSENYLTLDWEKYTNR